MGKVSQGEIEKEKYREYCFQIKLIGLFQFFFPIILFLIGYFMKRCGFHGKVLDYDKGIARIIQYIFFFLGVGILFFCDNISHFISNKLIPYKNIELDEEAKIEENLKGYSTYVLVMMGTLNLVTVFGFLGFLICGNFTWLTVFAILNILALFKYFPSYSRFSFLLRR